MGKKANADPKMSCEPARCAECGTAGRKKTRSSPIPCPKIKSGRSEPAEGNEKFDPAVHEVCARRRRAALDVTSSRVAFRATLGGVATMKAFVPLFPPGLDSSIP